MNNFGVDITPFLEPLAEEIENYQFLYFRKEYAGKLINIKDYYVKKRKVYLRFNLNSYQDMKGLIPRILYHFLVFDKNLLLVIAIPPISTEARINSISSLSYSLFSAE